MIDWIGERLCVVFCTCDILDCDDVFFSLSCNARRFLTKGVFEELYERPIRD